MTFAERIARQIQKAGVVVLGGAVLYRPVSGGEASIRGIWSSPYTEFEGEHGKVAARAPTLDVRRADIVASFEGPPALGDKIEINDGVLGVLTYQVANEPEDDGQGMVKLYLNLIP